ncbi:MAG: nucleotidyltransferase family protein [Pseudomonadota bacterium]
MPAVSGLLLAAGAGRRFGADKLLAPVDGVPMAVAALRALAPAVDRVVAVVRPGCGELAHRLMDEGASVSVFAMADKGMGASLAWGVALLPGTIDGLVVALADMPCIRPATTLAVAQAVAGGALLAAPERGGRRGHPVGFAACLRGELERLGGDHGARALVESCAARSTLISCDDPGIFLDVDTPADLASLARRAR